MESERSSTPEREREPKSAGKLDGKVVLGLWGVLLSLFLVVWRFVPASTASDASGGHDESRLPALMSVAFLVLFIAFAAVLVRRLRRKG